MWTGMAWVRRPVLLASLLVAVSAAMEPAWEGLYTPTATWQETLFRSLERLDMVRARLEAVPTQRSPERTTGPARMIAEPVSMEVDVTGWSDAFLVATITGGASDRMEAGGHAMLGGLHVTDASGHRVPLRELPYSVDRDWMHALWVAEESGLIGKGGRWQLHCGTRNYRDGALLWHGVVLHLRLDGRYVRLRTDFAPTPRMFGKEVWNRELAMVLSIAPAPSAEALINGFRQRLPYDFPREQEDQTREFADGIWHLPLPSGNAGRAELIRRYAAIPSACAWPRAEGMDVASAAARYHAALACERLRQDWERCLGEPSLAQHPEWKELRRERDHLLAGVAPIPEIAARIQALRGRMDAFLARVPTWLASDTWPTPRNTIAVASLVALQAALKAPAPGTEIVIADGLYEGGCTVQARMPADQPLVVRARHPGRAHFTRSVVAKGSGIIVAGLVAHQGDIIAEGERIRVTQCAALMGRPAVEGRQARMDHGFFAWADAGCGRAQSDGPVAPVRLDHCFFGERPRIGQGETIRSFTWGPMIEDSLFDHCRSEHEILSLKCTNTVLRRNTIVGCEGTFPGRSGGTVLMEGNYLFGVDNRNEPYPGKIVRNNYFDGCSTSLASGSPNPIYGSMVWEGNTVIDGRFRLDLAHGQPNSKADGHVRHTYDVGMTRNLVVSAALPVTGSWDHPPPHCAENVCTGGGGVSGWRTMTVAGRRDANGVWRPDQPLAALGFQRTDAPLSRFDSRVGPGYLPVAARINRALLIDATWNKPTGYPDAGDDVGFGIIPRPFPGADAQAPGISGQAGDGAFNQDAASAMGGTGRPACSRRLALADDADGTPALRAFTLMLWFRPVVPVGGGAVLVDCGASQPNKGFIIDTPEADTVRLRWGDGRNAWTLSASLPPAPAGTWHCLAVRVAMQGERGSGSAWMALGSASGPLRLAAQRETGQKDPLPFADQGIMTLGGRADGTLAFKGRMDALRLYAAFVRGDNPSNIEGALVELADLERLRRSDLGEEGLAPR